MVCVWLPGFFHKTLIRSFDSFYYFCCTFACSKHKIKLNAIACYNLCCNLAMTVQEVENGMD